MTCPEAGVEEDHQQRFVLAQLGEAETVFFDFECLGECVVQVAQIVYTGEISHVVYVIFLVMTGGGFARPLR